MNNWFTSIFSGEAKPNDAVKSGSLNITKITALLVPGGTAALALVSAAIGKKGPLAKITPGQRLIIYLFAMGFVLVVVVTDMLVRAYATGQAAAGQANSPVATLTPGIAATWTWIQPGPYRPCHVAGLRQSTTINPGAGEYLIFADAVAADPDTNVKASPAQTLWVGVTEVLLGHVEGRGV